MSEETWFVRLKPYDPRNGCVRQRYREVAWPGVIFLAGARPIGVNRSAAEHLKTIHQRHEDKGSPKAFDVWETEEEMRRALREEHFASLPRSPQSLRPTSSAPPQLTSVVRVPDAGPPATRREQIAMLEEQEAEEAQQPDAPVLNTDGGDGIDADSAFSEFAPSDAELEAQPPTSSRRGGRRKRS